jgi:hypothetical protein
LDRDRKRDAAVFESDLKSTNRCTCDGELTKLTGNKQR